ncbi:MAG: PorT family protein [Flammeovirgaceae bacterium]|nr:PorT family protein [Flammeovirgaceae bacterium]
MKSAKTKLIVGLSFLLGSLFATVTTYAQGPSVGLKGGLNYSSLQVENVSNESSRLGFHAGLAAKFPITDVLNIQPEIVYSNKGVEAEYDLAIFEGKNKLNLNYIDVPVLLVFDIAEVFNIHAGVYGSYLLDAKVKSDGDFGNGSTDLQKEDFNEFDYGASFGGGVDLGRVELGIRYNRGFRDVAKSGVSNAFVGDAKNSLLQVYTIIGLK